jgi:putative ATP-dependent endonuclease of OLD family
MTRESRSGWASTGVALQITRVVIQNYRTIRKSTIEFRPGVTIIVGDNETGKSTLLEAIHAALSGQVGGRSIRYQLHPYLFNRPAAEEFAKSVKSGRHISPPEVLVEVYFDDDIELARLKGSNNTRKEDVPGVSLRIRLDDSCAPDFSDYISGTADPNLLPVEFFEVEWMSFAHELMSGRRAIFRSTLIDPSAGDARRGTGRYLSTVVGEHLTNDEQIALSLAYRSMKLTFQEHPTVKKLNQGLQDRKGEVSEKTLSIAMDMSTTHDWDQGVAPLLDDIPFDLVGKGEQSAARIWLAVDAAKRGANLVMVEEPENHLSYARLNVLLERMRGQLGDRQMFVTTHSSFVVNKLGIDDVLLFHTTGSLRLSDLGKSTANYFKKLPGHDTLRMVLAKRVILVEGPSDELVVQRAYFDCTGKRPIEDGVDVLAVGALAFKRYLDIAVKLTRPVAVVTDNDGKPEAVSARYAAYADIANIRICFSDDVSARTLEPQLVKANTLEALRQVLGRHFKDKLEAERWMTTNKTDAALLIHDSEVRIVYPEYIACAIT